mgnify:CR=1 FL=1
MASRYGPMRGRSGEDSDIDVDRRVTPRGQHLGNPLQKDRARRPAPLRVGIGKILADIAEACRSKQRVAQRVNSNITVGMRGDTVIVWRCAHPPA